MILDEAGEEARRISDVVVLNIPNGSQAVHGKAGDLFVLPVQLSDLFEHLHTF